MIRINQSTTIESRGCYYGNTQAYVYWEGRYFHLTKREMIGFRIVKFIKINNENTI